MSDKPSSGPRRLVPVPGVPDLDAVEDANVADVFGKRAPRDAAPDAPSTSEPPALEPKAEAPAEADPLGLPAPPPLTPEAESVADDEPPPETPEEPGDPPVVEPDPDRPVETPAEPFDAAPPDVDAPEQAEASAVAPEAAVPEATVSGGAEPAPEPMPVGPTAEEAPGPAPLLPPRAVVDSAKAATRSRGRELVQLVVRYGKEHVPETPPRPVAEDTGPPRMVGRVGQLIPILRVVPWILAVVFGVSFWWDFEGMRLVLFGASLPLDGLLRVLAVSGLIGFGTNWLAITMLFQPREKRAIIPQGLIPAQRERVIYRLSEAISRELINADIIKQRIQESGVIGRYRDLALGVVRGVVEDPGFRTDLKTLATDYAQEVLGSEAVRREVAALAVQKVEEQAGQGLGGMALKLYRTFAEADFQRRLDRALDELPSAVSPLLDRIDTALDAVPQKVEARADEIEEAATRAVLSFVEGFDVRSMIQEKARGFDEAQLENLLKSTSNEQLNYIKYLGAILGVLGGLVIWQPLGALVAFTAVGLALWGLDEALVRARRSREGA